MLIAASDPDPHRNNPTPAITKFWLKTRITVPNTVAPQASRIDLRLP